MSRRNAAVKRPVLPDPQFNNEPPIRLLDARFLTKLSERGGWLVPRQSLPEDAFLDLEAVKLLRTHPHAGLRVLCISHIWLQPDHADPRRDTLHVLDVYADSPASAAGLDAFNDFVLGVGDLLLQRVDHVLLRSYLRLERRDSIGG